MIIGLIIGYNHFMINNGVGGNDGNLAPWINSKKKHDQISSSSNNKIQIQIIILL